MGINYGRAIHYGRNISSMGDDTNRLINNSKTLNGMIPSGYEGQDARIFLSALEQLQRELGSIASELKSLGGRIVSAADQIKREEEEEERRRREAMINSIKGLW